MKTNMGETQKTDMNLLQLKNPKYWQKPNYWQ